MGNETFDLWDRIWGAISKNEKNLAVTCHEIADLKDKIINLEKDIDKLIDIQIEKIKHKHERSMNIKIALVTGVFSVIVALIAIIPYLIKQ